MAEGYKESQIAVSTIASTSAFITGAFLLSISYLFVSDFASRWKGSATTSANTQSSTNSELGRVKNQFGFLFLNMLTCDFFTALGFALTGHWVSGRNTPAIGATNHFCEFQSVLISIGDLGSGLFSLVIALHTFIVLGTQYRVSRKACGLAVVLTWMLIVVLQIIGPLSVGTSQQPCYAYVGLWCFASNTYPLVRLWTHYLLLLASFFFCALTYIALYLHFKRYYNRTTDAFANEILLKTARSMLLYPLAYAVCAGPTSLYRLASLCGSTGPVELLAFGGIAFSLAGTVNLILYGSTRHVINLKAVKARIRNNRTIAGDSEFSSTYSEPQKCNIRLSEFSAKVTVHTEQITVYDHNPIIGKPPHARSKSAGSLSDGLKTLPVELHPYPKAHVVFDVRGNEDRL